MKQCPQCRRTYADDNEFCLEDGAVLMFADATASQSYSGDLPTVVMSNDTPTVMMPNEIPTVVVPKLPPTQYYENQPHYENQLHYENQPPLNTPPQFQVPPSAQAQTTHTGKWVYPVLGILLVTVVVLGLVVVVQFTKKDDKDSTNTNVANKETPKPSETEKPAQTTPTRETESYNTVPGKYPEGSTRALTANDLVGKSSWDLRIMRNEIFARHGRRFKSPELRNYFMSQSWYNPRFDEVRLTEIETRNVEFLKSYE